MEKKKDKKIIFTGLDNGGKTSIIMALQDSIAKISTLKPTLGVERSSFKFLDYFIHAHDLGGQKKYRIKYLKQPDKFFESTDICIYVIDIQDIIRYEEALSYLKDLLNQFEVSKQNPLIYVFFHKSEKILLENDSEGEKNIELLTEKIVDINKKRFFLEFKITTIYDIWSISSSFASIMQKIYAPSELIGKAMKELAENLNAEASVLFDENVLMLANFLKDKEYGELIQYTAPYFFTFQNFEARLKGKLKIDKMKLQLDQYEFLFIENRNQKPRLFLLLIGKTGTLPPLEKVSEIADQIPDLFIQLGINLGSEGK
ncbi:MAG: ADP-ribosylation factor-like protein [Promethearchaeota archaeon]